MVINLYKNGQLGNRLLHISVFIANSIEYKYELYYLSFPRAYEEYFNLIDNDVLVKTKVRFRFSKFKLVESVLRWVCNVMLLVKNISIFPYVYRLTIIPSNEKHNSLYCNLSDPRFFNIANKYIIFTEGWRFIDPISMKKHLPIIRKLFRPKDKFLSVIDKIIQTAREFSEIVVGVHIRRGDYKTYNKGKWYYNDDEYKKVISDTQKYLMEKNNNLSCIFLICSDDYIDTKNFNGLPVVYFKKNEIVDMYTLASCNYILAAPSTFSGWASYYGNVPIYYIDDPNESFCEEKLIRGFHNHFTENAQHCKSYY